MHSLKKGRKKKEGGRTSGNVGEGKKLHKKTIAKGKRIRVG